jgi:organic hydroperoxide reductase OsmC/OhrA
VFTARAHITGGRDGRATTDRGHPELALAVPAELGGQGSPEAEATELRASLPGVEPAKAAELMHAAHALCPYSRATRGNVPVRLFAGDDPV